MKIFTVEELTGRQNVMLEQLVNQIILEANCFLNMINTGIIPNSLKDHKTGLNNIHLEKFYQNKIDLLGNIVEENQKLSDMIIYLFMKI